MTFRQKFDGLRSQGNLYLALMQEMKRQSDSVDTSIVRKKFPQYYEIEEKFVRTTNEFAEIAKHFDSGAFDLDDDYSEIDPGS